jgi:cytochrome b561
MCFFGVVAGVVKPTIADRPWYWSLGFVVAAALNWRIGTKLNSKRLQKLQPQTFCKRLFYKAAHRFMSLPMETFSIVLVLIGAIVAVQSSSA